MTHTPDAFTPEAAPENRARPATARQLAGSTLMVMIAFGIAKVISLAQTVIIAQVFGVGREWDAFVTANSIPELIFTLIAGGALGHAFLPTFAGLLANHEREGAWQLASHVINVIFTTALVVCAIAFVIAPWLVASVVAPGFDAEAQAQTVTLMRILLTSTLIFSVSGIVMAMLQSHNLFLLPALAPILFDVGILFGVIFLIRPFGVYGIAYGAVIGAALHLAIQIPGLVRVRARWTPEWGWRDPALWRVIRLMLPRVAGLGVFSLNFIVMNNIASRMGDGAVSALSWGWRLMQIPQTLIGTAMGTVIFPTLAALSARNDQDGKRDAMSSALRFILVASIPASIGLILVGRPILRLLERGAFTAEASILVYSTLQFFALGIVVHSMLEIVARSFYADKDTYTPLWAALAGAAVNFALAIALTGVSPFGGSINLDSAAIGGFVPFNDLAALNQSRVGGLALANSIGTAIEVVILLWVLRRRWEGANESALARTTIKTLAASLIMALAILALNLVWTALATADRGLPFTVLEISVDVIVGGAVFLAAAGVLRLEELHAFIDLIRNRVRPAPVKTERIADARAG